MTERPDSALVAQRLRNRVIEALESVAEPDADLRSWGYAEYFESFFDQAPYEGEPYANEAMNAEEFASWSEFVALFQGALNETPRNMAVDAFIATGWPGKLAKAAQATLAIFAKRGRLSEGVIEGR